MRSLILTSLITSALLAAALLGFDAGEPARAQSEAQTAIRVGERLTYGISYNRVPNVAYAETEVVSKGKIGGKESFEVRSKFKSLNFMALGSLFLDVDRTSYISSADGTTLALKETDNAAGAPVAESVSYIEKSPGSFDLTSMLFRIRSSGGAGSYSMFENGKVYTVTLQTIGSEVVKSDAGEFPASMIEVKSDFLAEHGFVGLTVSIASEGSNIPVQFRLKRGKNSEYVGVIASIQVAVEATPTPTAAVVATTPRPTPRPTSTPPEYVNNQPLFGLPFNLGEKLQYNVTAGQRSVGKVVLEAKERKLVNKRDSLLLSATVIHAAGNEIFGIGNAIRSYVDPDTLAPHDFSMAFSGRLSAYNHSARFDQEAGRVTMANNERIDVPVGTHNIISLFYALRLFNLDPGKNSTNRVNDTRVSVFWEGRPNIFTLRPTAPKIVQFGDQKIFAQEITVSTGNPALDSSLRIKLWLSNDDRRLPLRFVLGGYQFDLEFEEAPVEP